MHAQTSNSQYVDLKGRDASTLRENRKDLSTDVRHESIEYRMKKPALQRDAAMENSPHLLPSPSPSSLPSSLSANTKSHPSRSGDFLLAVDKKKGECYAVKFHPGALHSPSIQSSSKIQQRDYEMRNVHNDASENPAQNGKELEYGTCSMELSGPIDMKKKEISAVDEQHNLDQLQQSIEGLPSLRENLLLPKSITEHRQYNQYQQTQQLSTLQQTNTQLIQPPVPFESQLPRRNNMWSYSADNERWILFNDEDADALEALFANANHWCAHNSSTMQSSTPSISHAESLFPPPPPLSFSSTNPDLEPMPFSQERDSKRARRDLDHMQNLHLLPCGYIVHPDTWTIKHPKADVKYNIRRLVVLWEWEERPRRFVPYSPLVMAEIELAYLECKTDFKLTNALRNQSTANALPHNHQQQHPSHILPLSHSSRASNSAASALPATHHYSCHNSNTATTVTSSPNSQQNITISLIRGVQINGDRESRIRRRVVHSGVVYYTRQQPCNPSMYLHYPLSNRLEGIRSKHQSGVPQEYEIMGVLKPLFFDPIRMTLRDTNSLQTLNIERTFSMIQPPSDPQNTEMYPSLVLNSAMPAYDCTSPHTTQFTKLRMALSQILARTYNPTVAQPSDPSPEPSTPPYAAASIGTLQAPHHLLAAPNRHDGVEGFSTYNSSSSAPLNSTITSIAPRGMSAFVGAASTMIDPRGTHLLPGSLSSLSSLSSHLGVAVGSGQGLPSSKMPTSVSQVQKWSMDPKYSTPLYENISREILWPSGLLESQINPSICRIRVLDTNSELHHRICKRIMSTVPGCKIDMIQTIENHWLLSMYSNSKRLMNHKKQGVFNERSLFRGTREIQPQEIYDSQEGFDMRFSKGGFYGTGVYFSENFDYAHRYAHRINDFTGSGNVYQAFLCHVLCGEAKDYGSRLDTSLRLPPTKDGIDNSTERYDSVTGVHFGSRIFVTYNNTYAYPTFLITYRVSQN
eukprot:TRINITY_DN4143_c0_g1_i1.p1 TRINITY_DN4143_c0_g1~~TRINITY_DN4143_c0_g1_i1.p1  ORF type:complete len:971 (-),score=182.02 TRINITY_DN4143_c0_g1_i1:584-3496(-)